MATIGVVALQGDFAEHCAAIQEAGASARPVRVPGDVDKIDGVVLPGGESTTMSMLMESSGLDSALRDAMSGGIPVFGTCAGMILLAREVLDGRADQARFAAIDISVRRNGYGRQRESFECDLGVPDLGDQPFHAIFIRAPVVVHAEPEVEVLGALEDDSGKHPVLCRQGHVLVAAFHPELTLDRRLHELFVSMIEGRA
jgi:5'-phosphate synthase pdxT subunit